MPSMPSMPSLRVPGERGRLIVEFQVLFPGPEIITEEVRDAMRRLLPSIPEFNLPEDTDVNNFSEHVAVDYVAREDEYARDEAYDSDGDERRHVHAQQGCTYQ